MLEINECIANSGHAAAMSCRNVNASRAKSTYSDVQYQRMRQNRDTCAQNSRLASKMRYVATDCYVMIEVGQICDTRHQNQHLSSNARYTAQLHPLAVRPGAGWRSPRSKLSNVSRFGAETSSFRVDASQTEAWCDANVTMYRAFWPVPQTSNAYRSLGACGETRVKTQAFLLPKNIDFARVCKAWS